MLWSLTFLILQQFIYIFIKRTTKTENPPLLNAFGSNLGLIIISY